MMKKKLLLFVLIFLSGGYAYPKVAVNHIFDDNMVLQREKRVKIWGWADPGEKVSVEFSGQFQETEADVNGDWAVFLKPMPANSRPQTLKVAGKENRIYFSNVLVGDVWVFGGQSNMEFDMERTFDGELEIMSAGTVDEGIRLITIPRVSSGKKELKDFDRIVQMDDWLHVYEDKGSWMECYSAKMSQFSTLGYMFGKTIHRITGVPVGLIDASLGGTTLEAWLSGAKMESMPENAGLLQYWDKQLAEYDPVKDLKKKKENWKIQNERRKKLGQDPLPEPQEPSPCPLQNRNFPAASYNAYISPIKGLAVKGAVFHHGYSNALSDARPRLYAANFKALIDVWREAFNDDEMPFGIIELSASGTPQTMDNYEVCMLDPAPFIREGQYEAYSDMKNVGYCCSYDYQVNWFHPQKKIAVGVRMARWALSEIYGLKDVAWEPAKVVKVETSGNTMTVVFDKEVKSSDDRPMEGFAIAGSNRRFFPAKAEYAQKAVKDSRGRVQYDKKRVVVSCPFVESPEAVRYAWARNPLANLVSDNVIPVPQYRSDRWEYPEAPFPIDSYKELAEHKMKVRTLNDQAGEFARERKIMEAEYTLHSLKENK